MSGRAELREIWRAAMSAASGTQRNGTNGRESARADLFRDTALHAAPPLPPEPEPEGNGDYLVFFAVEEGYQLLDADGPCPAPGDQVELEGVAYEVLKVATSPFPGDRRPCACLERRDAPAGLAMELSAGRLASATRVGAP
jgi:hypothetical protein